ncbi:MAG: amidohydrolase family protein [Chloroflexi bacterium]|nr:amidohydrolase family protein [Chloroflexota bacterium]
MIRYAVFSRLIKGHARTQLAHSIWLSDAEIELIAQSGAIVVHCPLSNMYTGAGVCRVSRLLERGIPVALATDGQTCNNGQEMIDLLRVTADLQKIAALDTPVLSAEAIFEMACRYGARAFGQPDLLGSLEPTKKADVVLVKPARTCIAPTTGSMSALIYGGSRADVDTVIVDGKILMRHGCITVLDEAALIAEARAAWNALRRRAGGGSLR